MQAEDGFVCGVTLSQKGSAKGPSFPSVGSCPHEAVFSFGYKSRTRGSGWLGLGRPKYLEEKVKPAWFCQSHRRSMVRVSVLDPRGGTVGNRP